MSFHRRRTTRLEVAIRQPFIEKTPPPPPVNIIHQALTARSFMQANPDATPFSAASKLNLHRKRIAKLLQIVDMLPKSFVKEAKNYTDPAILRRMSAGALSDVLQYADSEQVARKLQKLVTLPSPDPQK